MSKLTVTANQHSQILEALNASMDSAFGEGVQITPATPYLDPVVGYLTKLKTKERKGFKDTFKQVFATLVSTMNWDRPGVGTPAVPVVVPLVKLTGGGSNGSLTIVGGLIVAVTPPT